MSVVNISFKREGKEGVVPVGSYLSDACKRLGVMFDGKCRVVAGEHFCSVNILEGESLLTPPTKRESEYFSENPADMSTRLACQTKIESAGDIVVMTPEKEVESEKERDVRHDYAREFRDMPLEKKISDLLQLEVIAVGETISFIMNSPYLIADKIMDVMADFGREKERVGRAAGRPDEHAEDLKEKTDAKKGDRKTTYETKPDNSMDQGRS